MYQILSTLIESIKAIPDVIWGIIIGSLLTWIGIYLQLKHDSREKEKERKMSLRRDVYLLAAEKFGQELSYLMNFFQTSKPSPEGYHEAITQIDMIGNNETIVAINSFNDFIVEAFLELVPLRENIDRLLKESDRYTKQAERNRIKADKHLQEKKEYIQQGIVDTQRLSFIEAEYQLAGTFEEESLNKLKDIAEKVIKLNYELSLKCQQKSKKADELMTPIIVAIRKELDFSFDYEAYIVMKKESVKKWGENLEQYNDSMKHMYEEMLNRSKRENHNIN